MALASTGPTPGTSISRQPSSVNRALARTRRSFSSTWSFTSLSWQTSGTSEARGHYRYTLIIRVAQDGDQPLQAIAADWSNQAVLGQTSTEGRNGATALIEPLSHVHGLSSKVLSMALSALLLAGDPKRELWKAVGADMIAIDTLVHAWLHRTGILRGLDAEHAYGPSCYASGNCSDIVRLVAMKLDGRAFNIEFPAVFPRFVQHAIWRFCAQQQLNQCNGNQITDTERCWLTDCILFDSCARLKLGRTSPVSSLAKATA